MIMFMKSLLAGIIVATLIFLGGYMVYQIATWADSMFTPTQELLGTFFIIFTIAGGAAYYENQSWKTKGRGYPK